MNKSRRDDSDAPGSQSVLDCRCCATCWERDLKRVCIWWFWEISPHFFLYLFLFKRKIKVETKRTLLILNTGESKLYLKKEKCLKHQFFFWEFGLSHVSALFMVVSSTMGIHPADINGDVVPKLHHHFLIYHRSSCKVSAQIQLRALQRCYDK